QVRFDSDVGPPTCVKMKIVFGGGGWTRTNDLRTVRNPQIPCKSKAFRFPLSAELGALAMLVVVQFRLGAPLVRTLRKNEFLDCRYKAEPHTYGSQESRPGVGVI